ncbi:transforming acidic coiled-coil-containing protein 1 isoform X2 [Ochlerotatus camptorhynchus]|uniref:transforming acidic coiled-coil-containing protein 1 isoform X2 n=1 Tax=Ochlerotatus camptorhynchus TaxID=644619 RepID=UPI0031DF2A65
MSDDEAQIQSEEEVTETPKKGRGRPKKPETPASGEAAEEDSFPLHHTGGRDEQEEVLHFPERISLPIVVPPTLTPTPTAAQEQEPPSECEFKVPPLPPLSTGSPSSDLFADTVTFHGRPEQGCFLDHNSEFQPSQNYQFAASDFDFLLSKGGGNEQEVETPRDSLLLRFDPLLKVAPLVNSGRLSVTREEEQEEEQQHFDEQELVSVEGGIEISNNPPPVIIETAPAAEDGVGESPDDDHHHQEQLQPQQQQQHQFCVGEGGGVLLTGLETSGFIAAAVVVSPTSTTFCASTTMDIDEEAKNLQPHCADDEEADEKMSVDNTMILDGESSTAERNTSYMEPDQDFNGTGVSSASSNSNSELLADKRSKNESLKIEELQKKLSEAELREEALLKRITDKDKAISKMSGVVEAYERTIADLITQKEQTTQSYEKTCEALKTDSDINAQHLESLEKTFSDLHAKYERMKVMTAEYKEREEELVNERNRCEESLRMQEKRYENMKSHAMTQLEIANNKLSELVRNHAQEVTKLKALLKKEEIYRASVNEQLSQKTRENEELVKICEELINGGAN